MRLPNRAAVFNCIVPFWEGDSIGVDVRTKSSELGLAWFPGVREDVLFCAPESIVCAMNVADVVPALHKVQTALAQGFYAAGYVAYEAAAAFEPAFQTHPFVRMPLLWFALYRERQILPPLSTSAGKYTLGEWHSLVDKATYSDALQRIHMHIAAGDTYQVNYTFPMRAAFQGESLAWFRVLCAAQRQGYFGYLDTGRHKILSASPELFFSTHAGKLCTRPMKGTRPRGRFPQEDAYKREALQRSDKDRAENLMIVDLLRNDVGRISETGTVSVPSLFDVEPYPTVWQMTSTVTARSQAKLGEIFAALFPCGSITGAPKIETMKIIRNLEPYPRGVYCGAVGWCAPNGAAQFNVAIRTAVVDAEAGEAEYHVGGGITWDSVTTAEYQECCDKARILHYQRPAFQLLESLRYENGYQLLNAHVERLLASAAYFDIPLNRVEVLRVLKEHAEELRGVPVKVRLLVDQQGKMQVMHTPLERLPRLRLGWATAPVDSQESFLFHKTTHREVYTRALAQRLDCDEVLLWNTRDEVTEATRANVVVTLDGRQYTPPVDCGLLPGTFRGHLLQEGVIEERLITRAEMARATEVQLINSVRGWIAVDWEPECAIQA